MIPALQRLGGSLRPCFSPATGQLDRNHNAVIVQSSIILSIIHCGDDTEGDKHHRTAVLCTNDPSVSVLLTAPTLIILTPGDAPAPYGQEPPLTPAHCPVADNRRPGLPGAPSSPQMDKSENCSRYQKTIVSWSTKTGVRTPPINLLQYVA